MICSVLAFLLLLTPAQSTLLPPEKLEHIDRGMDAMLNGQWERAYGIFEDLHRRDITDPGGYLFRASVWQAEMIDREEDLFGSDYFALLDSVVISAEKRLISCTTRDSALCYLFIGHQFAYRSIWEARFGSKFAALGDGFKAKGWYRDGLQIDSTLYDLYLGLGTYHYWKSVKSGILRTVGVFKNEKEQGIREIRLAVDSSLFSKDVAASELIWVMLNEEEYDQAIALCRDLLKRFPDGISFRWPLAEAHLKSERYHEAIDEFQAIFDNIRENPGNYFNVIEAAFWLYHALDKIGADARANSVLEYMHNIHDNIPKSIRRKQRDRLWSLRRRGK
ncbi:MAG: tetratricopeptide repeat protein [candidate division Zixibacteria bacterium]|nr:tetratricopeptide repeat protein [candidate division Zixibacteria bacterium]